MQRRSFLMSMAGAFVAPLINLRPAIDREKLMIPFCDPHHMRYDFASPFGVGSLTYATDARAMVRCELENRDVYGERRIPKNLLDVWKEHWNHNNQWIPIHEFLVPTERLADDYEECPECGDRRIDHGDEFPEDTSCLLDFDCKDNSSRDPSCVLCKGKTYKGPCASMIGPVLHGTFKLRRIAALPNASVCPSLSVVDSILFKADGFEGVSMGLIKT